MAARRGTSEFASRLPLFEIYWDQKDIESVTNAIKSGSQWAIGPNVARFEEMIAKYIGTDHCVVFNSGTSALHSLMIAYGLKSGDEVIVPSFTFISTVNSILFVGAKPVFADIEDVTFGLDPEKVRDQITKKTRAILPVHYAGCPCLIRELKDIADDNKLILIEDAAESFGARIGGRKVGTFGDAAVLSFCQNKIISTGDGGAVVTDSDSLVRKLKLIRSHGRSEDEVDKTSCTDGEYVALGYNFRMSNIVAALGVSQLAKVGKLISLRRKMAEYLSRRFLEEQIEILVPKPPDKHYHVYQMYTVRSKRRDQLMHHLSTRNIDSKVYFNPVHKTVLYKNVLGVRTKLPVTEKIAGEVLSLPMFPSLRRIEADRVVREVKSCCGTLMGKK